MPTNDRYRPDFTQNSQFSFIYGAWRCLGRSYHHATLVRQFNFSFGHYPQHSGIFGLDWSDQTKACARGQNKLPTCASILSSLGWEQTA